MALPANASYPDQAVALCLIVKDEEANLPACLESAAGLAAEIVVVDTGSTDGTRAIAARFGARVIDFPWCDDFAAARNEALRHATAPWIFWMDADDRLDEANRCRLRTLFAGLKPEMTGFLMSCVSWLDPRGAGRKLADHVRLFPNHPSLRWCYRVHEQILPALLRQGGKLTWTDVEILHTGYQDAALARAKLERNLRLLERDFTDNLHDPHIAFNLGWTRLNVGQTALGLQLLERCAARPGVDDSMRRKAHALLAGAARECGRHDRALDWCRRGRESFPDDTELLFLEGMLLFQFGQLSEAAQRLESLLTAPAPRCLALAIEDGLRGYRTRYNLGIIYRDQRRFADAEVQWRQCLAEAPHYCPPRLALGELLAVQQRWAEAEDMSAALRRNPAHVLDAEGLRARIHLGRREFAPARKILERLVARHADAVWPRILLARVLHEEGQDLPAARKILRSVLAVQPAHPEALARLRALGL